MAIEKVSFNLRTYAFSYSEMMSQGFEETFTQDYLDQVSNIQQIADVSDELVDQVNTNTDDIAQNKADIAQNKQDIQTNADNIQTNSDNIQTNSDNISTNATNISNNTTAIVNNTTAIGNVASDLNDHEISTTEHGVTGNNVGTGDYAQSLVGGVVNLAALVADLTEIVTPDVGAAPATYDQTYTQSVTDLTNENKAKVNEIVQKVNEILAGQILAKQMSAV